MVYRWKLLAVVLLLLFFSQLAGACRAPARRPAGEEPNISLYLHETGEIKRINLEEYLLGVVAAEMTPDWHQNALAAQAILARTYTMKKIMDGGVEARGTDASTDIEEFQAYDADKVNDNVRQAVESTRGQVVMYQGNYINGWFHAYGGSRTAASAVEGLSYEREEAPYIHSVPDPGQAITTAENKSWTADFSSSELAAAVKKVSGQNPGSIKTISIAERGPSGRVTRFKVNGQTVNAPALRLALGSERLRSTLISDVTLKGERVVFAGEGYGHGVGMSQWGARALAEQGKTPEEIINYFFKDIELVKVW
ncbi:MAG: SpoIID/LytB domain-containing protein [Clostridia bacterium]|nr:SpoIID/LytB domain-containing protein [Clostridia bacterium]